MFALDKLNIERCQPLDMDIVQVDAACEVLVVDAVR